MDTLIKADVFFFIASSATVVLGILAAILLFYLIRAARNLHQLSEALTGGLKEGGEFFVDLKDRLESNVIFRLLFPPRNRTRLKK